MPATNRPTLLLPAVAAILLSGIASGSALERAEARSAPEPASDAGEWRRRALDLLEENVSEPDRRRHAVGVEAMLRALAGRVGGDPLDWGLAGLLHDVDRSWTNGDPARHGIVGAWLVADGGFPAEVARAIASHDDNANVAREAPLDYALHCADQLYWAVLASGVPLSSAGPEPTPDDVRAGLDQTGRSERLSGTLRGECESFGLGMDEVIRVGVAALRDSNRSP